MSGRLDDIELLTLSVNGILEHASKVENNILDELQISAATSLVRGLRAIRLQRTIVGIGVFSLFESLLQDQMNWDNPFVELDEFLRSRGHDKLAGRFGDYRLAINVLKHGRGRSLTQLLERSNQLEFRVKPDSTEFFFEGDVVEGQSLIDVDNKFVERCTQVVEEACAIVLEAQLE